MVQGLYKKLSKLVGKANHCIKKLLLNAIDKTVIKNKKTFT